MSASLVGVILVAVLVFWALGAYNRLVHLRGQVTRSLQALAQQWQSQAQALAMRLEQYSQGRESESQWASLDEDALRWRPLTLAARQFLTCLAVLQAKPNQMAAIDDVSSVRAARDIFENQWLRLINAMDDLAGAPMPPDLQQLWAQHETLAQERLREYSLAMQAYHHAIGQFPAVLLAWLFGFEVTGELSS